MKKGISILLFSIITLCSLAQNQKVIRGRIIDNETRVLGGAVIAYVTLPDSVVTQYAISDTNGYFEIVVPEIDRGVLEVSYLGYEKTYVYVKSDVLEIMLQKSSFEMDEVVVSGNKPTLEKEAGKFVYSPLGSVFAQGMDTYELLKFMPILMVKDDVISMLGKGNVTIYINGRKPNMSQMSLMDVLRSTPAERIEKIELITSPNSSYKASFTGGVVNIILKKDQTQGVMGSVTVRPRYTSERFSPGGSLYLGYAKKKFSASANLGISNSNTLTESDAIYNYTTTGVGINNYSESENSYLYLSGYFSAAYDFNSKSKMGASFSISGVDYWKDEVSTSKYYTERMPDSTLRARTTMKTPEVKPGLGVNVYYNLKTDTLGSNLDISVDYTSSYSHSSYKTEYDKLVSEGRYDTYRAFRQEPIIDVDGVELKVSYTKIFADDAQLQAGLESYYARTSNDFSSGDKQGDSYVTDEALSNVFVHKEMINSAYLNYNRKWNSVFSSSVGLRAEHTLIDGDQKTQNESFKRNHFNVFPSLNLNWNLADGDHNLSLDLGSYIFRPYYSDLNPFKRWISQSVYRAGNKDLKPTIIYNANMIYVLKKDYVFSVFYNYDKNNAVDYTGAGENNTTVISIAECGYHQSLSFSFNVNKYLFDDLLNLSVNLNAYYDMARGELNGQNIDFSAWNESATIQSRLRLSKKHKIDLSAYYIYSPPNASITKSFSTKNLIGASLKKQFKFGGVLDFEVSNLLNYRHKIHHSYENYSFRNRDLNNGVDFSISYRHFFGRSKVRAAQDRSSGGVRNRIQK